MHANFQFTKKAADRFVLQLSLSPVQLRMERKEIDNKEDKAEAENDGLDSLRYCFAGSATACVFCCCAVCGPIVACCELIGTWLNSCCGNSDEDDGNKE